MTEIEQIESRLLDIKTELETRSDLELADIEERKAEVAKLTADKVRLVEESRQAVINAFNNPNATILKGEKSMEEERKETRAEQFARTNMVSVSAEETRAAILSSGAIAKPTGVDGIYDNTLGELGILNEVTVKNYPAHEMIVHAYKKSNATADAHTEGNIPTESENEYGIINVASKAFSVISFISRAIKRLTPLDYEGEVVGSAIGALRTKAEEYIISQIPTCANQDGEKLATAVTLTETKISDKTLRNIVLNYRPGRKHQGIATLFLTRAQLVEFGDVRGTNEKKAVYEITPDQDNVGGIIRDGGLSVRYHVVDGLTNMMYGYLPAFELDLFGPFEVAVDEGYKFGEGLLTVRGEMWIGGSLTVSGAFEVISFSA